MNNPSASEETTFAEMDRQFARFIVRFGGDRDLVEKTAMLLSRAIRQGHIYFNLGDPRLSESAQESVLPNPVQWRTQLLQSRAFGSDQTDSPIVVAGDRLYLRRYWDYERELTRGVLNKAGRNAPQKKSSGAQEDAIHAALTNYFTIISGGPGTGKTTTVLKILLQLLQQPNDQRLRIALAAPTGKAAARLQELLGKVQEDTKLKADLKESMPKSATTIHRLLGVKPDSVFFRHDARNPLPLDVLVIDEASMVALPLMAKLFDALLPHARVILLGDRDQLASVEPGAVLADMAEAALTAGSPLENAMVVLSRNYRFGNDNAIYRLSVAVRTGETEQALQILRETGLTELERHPVPAPTQLVGELEPLVAEQYSAYLKEKEPAAALASFQRFRVLCALREGPFGVKEINRAIEGILYQRGLISDPRQLYAGRPILITRNDYQTRLFNGDIGVLLPDGSAENPEQLWAWFIGQDNQLRRLSPGRLPDYELAYAMTVHKAQGSEFERVLLLLPERDSPVLNRELIYTGVTRASERVEVWFNEEVLRSSIARQAERRSGLKEALLAGVSNK